MSLRLFFLCLLTMAFCSKILSQASHHRLVNIRDCNRYEAIFTGKITDFQSDGETVWIKVKVVEAFKYRLDTCEIWLVEIERLFPAFWNVNIGEEWLIFTELYKETYYLSLLYSSPLRRSTFHYTPEEGYLYKSDISFLQKTFFHPSQLVNESYQTSWLGCVSDDQVYHARGALVNGYPTGPWQYLYESKRVKESGNYFAGKKTGLWYGYYENGELYDKTYFVNGEQVSRTVYDKAGRICYISSHSSFVMYDIY
ncbi:MAG: toxin-antitoxin system YwqK family antitoxin [Bacteroidia bacterium]